MTTIVVIEDHYPNARMADKLLTRAGYTVLIAEDGEMGLTTVFENEPDLILIDLGLPDIDGQTVIGLIRQQASLKDLPIIAFTAWPEDDAHDMAIRYGCDGVITKPINTRLFASQITEFLSIATKDEVSDDDVNPSTEGESSVAKDNASDDVKSSVETVSSEVPTINETPVDSTSSKEDIIVSHDETPSEANTN